MCVCIVIIEILKMKNIASYNSMGIIENETQLKSEVVNFKIKLIIQDTAQGDTEMKNTKKS